MLSIWQCIGISALAVTVLVISLSLFVFVFYICVKLGTYGYLRGRQLFEQENPPDVRTSNTFPRSYE